MIVGSGQYKYERVERWAKIPEYFVMDDPVDISIDSRDRVYVSCRGNHPVLIFDRDGNFVSCWGEGYFIDPHGIFIGPDDSVYVCDSQTHTVEKLTPGGELLNLRLGTRNRARTVLGGMPFNMPSDVSLGPTGDIFVCNGYGNFLVHKFSPNGKLIKTWGGFGRGPGQFVLPHKLDVDRHGTVYVCDRNIDRVQLFTSDGKFIDMWTDFHWPQDLYIDRQNDICYVAECIDHPPFLPKVTIRDLKGNILSAFEGRESEGQGVLEMLHSICVDSHGDIYVGEITGPLQFLEEHGLKEILKAKRVQKFVKVS